MANVVQLDDQSFYLDSSTGGAKSTLKLRIGGAVLVMFTMPKCRGCNTFKPKFFEIASRMAEIAARNVVAALTGQPIPNQVSQR